MRRGEDQPQACRALSHAEADRYRRALEAAGFGPVEVRRCRGESAGRYLLDVRIGPFRRVASDAAVIRRLLDERQACYF
jgi:hypothetical protein